MDTGKRYLWQKLVVAACAFLLCVLTAFGIAMNARAETGSETGTDKEYELTVSLAVKDGYAFTSAIQGDQDKMFDLVDVTVTYTEKLAEGSEATPEVITKQLMLLGAGSHRQTSTGEVVDFSFADDAITATVNPRPEYGTASVTSAPLAVEYVDKELRGIVGEYVGEDGANEPYEMYMTPSVYDFDVYFEYNDGTRGDYITNDCFNVNLPSDGLFPDTLLAVDAIFYKDIIITLNEKGAALGQAGGEMLSGVARVPVKFSAPTSIGSVTGSFDGHPARSTKLNISKLNVTLQYNIGSLNQTYTVPVSQFKDAITTEYGVVDRRGNFTAVGDGKTLTTAVKNVKVTFTYPGTSLSATGYPAISVTPISIATPTFPSKAFVNYYNGVSITVGGLDYSGQFDEPLPKVTMKTVSLGTGGNADFSVPADDQPEGGYKVVFNKPATKYTITATLENGGDFQWGTPAEPAVRTDNYTITYTIQVAKGEFKISLSSIESEYTYGDYTPDGKPTGGVTGVLQGSADATPKPFTYNETVVTGDAVNNIDKDTLNYHLEYCKVGTGGALTGGWTNGFPVDAGKYKIKAVTQENEYYLSAESQAADLTIAPKLIAPANALKNPTYDRTEYTGNAILNNVTDISDVVSGDDPQLTAKITENGGKAKYWQSGGYAVELKTDNTNYILKELTSADTWYTVDDDTMVEHRKDTTAKFEIKKREIYYALTQPDFHYGDPADITVTKKNDGAVTYLKDPTIKYTHKANVAGTAQTTTYSDRASISTWDAGSYNVSYTPIYGGSDAKEKASLTLTEKNKDFSIFRANVNRPTIADTTVTYKKPAEEGAHGHEFTVCGTTIAAGGLGKYTESGLSAILTITVEGTRADFTKIENLPLGTTDVKIGLTTVDTYTVKVSIKEEAKNNFVWVADADGAITDPTATWKIIKAEVELVTTSTGALTYNHAYQDVELVNWNEELITLEISGKDVDLTDITDAKLPETGKAIAQLMKAGTYTFTFTLNDFVNYKWKADPDAPAPDPDAEPVPETDTIEFTFTVDRAQAALVTDKGEIYFDDTKDQFFVLPEAAKITDGSVLETLTFVFDIKDTGNNKCADQTDATTTKITKSDVYTYTITDLAGDEAVNYVLPAGGLTFVYTVKSQALDTPTFAADCTLTYNGGWQSVLRFITNYYNEDGTTSRYDDRVVIAVKKGETPVVSNEPEPSVKDVYCDSTDVGTLLSYTVEITPAGNYTWKDAEEGKEKEPFKFDVIVERYQLTVNWQDGTDNKPDTLKSVYGAEKHTEPVAVLDVFEVDEGKVNVTPRFFIPAEEGKAPVEVTLSSTTDAGNYVLVANEEIEGGGLSGDADVINNYQIQTNDPVTYTIKKQTVAKPVISGEFTAEFNGIGDSFTDMFGNLADYVEGKAPGSYMDAEVSAYRPGKWFGTDAADVEFASHGASFDVATGKLAYSHAAYYKITFTIRDGKNYCWNDDANEQINFSNTSYTYTWGEGEGKENEIVKVERKKLVAPAFGTRTVGEKKIQNRAQEFNDFVASYLEVNKSNIGVAVTVRYGTRTRENPADEKSPYKYDEAISHDVLGDAKQGSVGQYYVLVSVTKKDGVDILDYVWGDSADGNVSFVDGADTKTYGDAEVAIRLHYAITNSQLPLNFEDITYIFGDNGSVEGVIKIENFFSQLKLDAESTEKLTTAGMTWVSGDGTDKVKINNVTFVDSATKNELGTDDLENGLPWNAGSYEASFTVVFGNTFYEPLTYKGLKITVNARTLKIKWHNLVKTYDGKTDNIGGKIDKKDTNYAVTEITNAPLRNGQTEVNLSDLPTLLVKDSRPTQEIKNADNYSLIAEIDNDDSVAAKNFTAAGAYNSWYDSETSEWKTTSGTIAFVINPFKFTATPIAVAKHVYGEAIPQGTDKWNYSIGDGMSVPTGFENDRKNIVLKVMDGSSEVTKPVVGGNYTISLDWATSAASTVKGNYDPTFVNGTAGFTVVRRQITATITGADDAGVYSSVYYDEVLDHNTADYANTVELTNGTGSAIIGTDSPFKFSSVVNRASSINAVGYPISIEVTDNNYEVTVLGASFTFDTGKAETGYTHVITPATLTPTVEARTSETYNAAQFSYLKKNQVTGSNLKTSSNPSGMEPVWYIYPATANEAKPAVSASKWAMYNSTETHFGQASGDYYFYVMVMADNHTPVITSETPYHLAIAKAKLVNATGIMSNSFVYDALDHAYLDGQSVDSSTVKESDIGAKWYIGIATSESTNTDGITWEPFDANTHKIHDVEEAVYYYVKVTADNHDDLVLGAAAAGENLTPYSYKATQATLRLTVNMSIFYNERNPAVAGYYMDGDVVTIEKLKAGYGKVFFVTGWKQNDEDKLTGESITLEGLGGTFKYEAAAYKQKTSGVGPYNIEVKELALTSKNYTFDWEIGTLTVSALEISATITEDSVLEANYGDTGLAMPKAAISTKQTSTYDNTKTVDTSNLSYTDVLTVSTDALVEDGTSYTTNVVKYDEERNVVGYDVVLTLTDNVAWNDVGYTTVQYIINRAENVIVTDGYTLFESANAVNGETGEIGDAAWVYGKHAADGYRYDGAQALKDFTLLYHDDALGVKLEKLGASGAEWSETINITAANKNNIKAELDKLFDNVVKGFGFGAGEYKVTYTMAQSDNYNEFKEVWRFKVDKRNITVTPGAVSVVYGDEVDAEYLIEENVYKYTHTDLDGYGDTAETISEILGFAFVTVDGETEKNYTPGWNVGGTYSVMVKIGDTFAYYAADALTHETANYVFEFEKSTFTVTPRPVSIQIKDANKNYMLIGAYDYGTREYEKQTWSFDDLGYAYMAGSKQFFGDAPVVFRTSALVDENTTKPHGDYAIYALFKFAQDKLNYTITVSNALYGETVDKTLIDGTDEDLVVKTDGELVGGVFTVNKATLYSTARGAYFEDENGEQVEGAPQDKKYTLYASSSESQYANVYDGRAKHFFASAGVTREDLKDLIPSFEPVYSKYGTTETLDGAPKDVGHYLVTFSPVGEQNVNFNALSVQASDIYINPRRLDVTSTFGGTSVSTGKVTYSGGDNVTEFTFSELVAGELLGVEVTVGKSSDKCDPVVTYPSAGENRDKFSVTASHVGTYTINVKLSGDGMGNYTINKADDDGKYVFTLTIEKKKLYVVVQDASIEYGTTLNPNTLFKRAYSYEDPTATKTTAELEALVNKNFAANDLTKPADIKYIVNGGSDGSSAYSPVNSHAGTTYAIAIDRDKYVSENFDVTLMPATLTVTPRKISVTVNGYKENSNIAHGVYDGTPHDTQAGKKGAFELDYEAHKTDYIVLANGTFGDSGKTEADLVIDLDIGTSRIDAGQYPISATDNDPDFEIAFLYKGSSLTATNYPVYQIDKRALIAKVQGAGTNYESAKSTVNVIYGNDAPQSLFTVCYSGYVESELARIVSANSGKVKFAIGETSDTYVKYDSIVGDTFDVAITDFVNLDGVLKNYAITYEKATLAITPRPITASTENRVFDPDPTDNYRGGGKYGKPVEAQITFGKVDTQDRLLNGYKLSYNTRASEGQEAGKAPVKCDEYEVTVTLEKNSRGLYNYTFAADTAMQQVAQKLPYALTQKSVNLVWSENTVYEAKNVALNGGFVSSVMTIVSFTRDGKELDAADYHAGDDGLNINVGAINGRYTITVELKSTATNNYKLVERGSGESMETVSRRVTYFTVSLSGNLNTRIEFVETDMGSWVYGGTPKTAKAKVIQISTGNVIEDAVYMLDYVLATKAPSDAVLNKSYSDAEVSGWYENIDWTSTVSAAGKYLVRARYAGTTQYHAANNVYYYFEIEKKQLDKPGMQNPDSYVYAENDSHVGYIEGKIENYLAAAMQIVNSDVQSAMTGSGMTLYASGKGEFSLKIQLTDKSNYEWKDGTTDDVTVTWSIAQGTGNAITWDSALETVPYAQDYTLTASTDKFKYNIVIEYAYAVRGDDETEPSDSVVKISGLPVNAGKYWVFATGYSPEGNYEETSCNRAFEITKTKLTLRPTGSMTFGQTFDGTSTTMNSYTVASGLLNGDTEQMIMRDLKNVRYTVTDAPDSGLWQVGRYILTVSATATNYEIRSLTVVGSFTVNRARLYVTIASNASSLYGQTPTYKTDTDFAIRDAVAGDDTDAIKAAIRAAIVCDATADSDVGRYTVGLNITQLPNYDLVVSTGVYMINKLPVLVEVDWGGYDYNADPVLPSIRLVKNAGTQETITLPSDVLSQFVFVYAATGNSTAPTTAGSHVVSVRVADDSNYTLAAPVSGTLEIRLIELDASLIKWETVYYDIPSVKRPQVVAIEGNAFTKDMFSIDYIGDWDRAGVAYTIELKLNYPESTKWKTVEGLVRTLTYTVSRGTNELTQAIAIAGWVYGEYSSANLPTASAKFGTVSFEYSDSENGVYTTAAPANGGAGTYWVRAVVGETTDYENFVSPAVSFVISKKAIDAPTLDIVTEGNLKNDVYTGVAMQADVENYNSSLAFIHYDGMTVTNGDHYRIVATDAGSYIVTFTLKNTDDYKWADGTTLDEDGNAIAVWTIAKKKLARPKNNDVTLIVNGSVLTWLPLGFDSDTMLITGNTSSYGGTFYATVTLRDTDNYEWEGGEAPKPFKWTVVGADTVFAIVISVISTLALGAAIAALVEGIRFFKKKSEQKKKEQQSADAREKA